MFINPGLRHDLQVIKNNDETKVCLYKPGLRNDLQVIKSNDESKMCLYNLHCEEMNSPYL